MKVGILRGYFDAFIAKEVERQCLTKPWRR